MARRSKKPAAPAERKATGMFVGTEVREDVAKDAKRLQWSTDPKRLAQARLAIERSKRQEPGLSRLATSIARKPIKVVMKSDIPSSMTDGRTVWVKPDIGLGLNIEHKGRLCSQRDPETELQLCAACARVDDSARKFFHEMGHVVFESFDTMPDADIVNIIERTIAERGGSTEGTRAKKLLALLDHEKGLGRLTYLRAAQVISPYLPMLVNCLEDARVNAAMYAIRSGLQVMFRAEARRFFVNGIAQDDGTTFHWSEAGPNAQALIGTYLLAAGYGELVEQLSPEVQEALKNPKLRIQLRKIAQARSVEAIYSAAFPVLEALREEGFCKRHDDPEDEPKPPPMPMPFGQPEKGESGSEGESATPPPPASGSTPEEDDDTEGEGAGPGTPELEEAPAEPEPEDDDEAEAEGAGGDDKDDDEDDEDDAAGSGSDEADDEDEDEDDEAEGAGDEDDEDDPDDGLSPEELAELLRGFMGHDPDGRVTRADDLPSDTDYLKAAELQGGIFDDSSPNVYTLNLHHYGKPIYMPTGEDRSAKLGWSPFIRSTAQAWDEKLGPMPAGALNISVAKARLVFGANRAITMTKGLRAGMVDAGRLSQVAAGKDDVFARRVFPDARDYFALIGLDISGSTATPQRFPIIRQLGGAMSDLFERTGVKFASYAHTGYWHEDGTVRGGTDRPLIDVDIFEIKSPTDPWGRMQKRALADLTWGSQNLDGHTLEFYRKIVEAQRAKVRMLFYLTDGAMPAENREEETVILKANIKICQQLGIHLVALALDTDSPLRYGLDTITFSSAADLPRVTTEIGQRLRAAG